MRLHDGDVGARGPDLAGGLAVPPPTQHIIACRDARRDNDTILDCVGAAWGGLDGGAIRDVLRQSWGVLAIGVRAGAICRVPRWAAARTFPRAVFAMGRSIPVARNGSAIRVRVDGPAFAAAFGHDGTRHINVFERIVVNHPPHVLPAGPLQRKLQRRRGKACLGQVRAQRANLVDVAAALRECGSFGRS